MRKHKNPIYKIEIYAIDNKVFARSGDMFGEARCSPEDEFDFFVGAKLALEIGRAVQAVCVAEKGRELLCANDNIVRFVC